jgi:nitrite reductase (NADH) small subunit
MGESVALCAAADIPPGAMGGFSLGPQVHIVVCNVQGTFHALANVCPHRSAALSQGSLDGGLITCPWHGWQFDAETGRGVTNPHSSVPNFGLRVEEGRIVVEL